MKQPLILNNTQAGKRLGIKTVVFRILLALIAFLLIIFLIGYCFVISKLNKLDRTSSPANIELPTTASVETDAEISTPDDDGENKAMQ